jgi:ribosomal protein S18 acetylase RimI-like enzyme
MNPLLTVRMLTRDDLSFADSVRALAGWNQTVADWERFIATEPQGCFLAEQNGVPVGTATTTVYSPALAWIGMVLVHPDHRGRGIGRTLLEHCMAHLHNRGVRCIKLDATPAGKKVYDGLGFKDEGTLTRWEYPGACWPHAELGSAIRELRDVDAVETIDTDAFGVSRRKVLRPLIRQGSGAVVCESGAGEVAGYGLLREGSSALYLGPIVATSDAVGVILVKHLLACAGERKIYWDIPDQNVVASKWVGELGFTRQRTLTRMYLGINSVPGNVLKQYAIAGPEVG